MSGRAPHRISETMVSQAEHGQWMSVAELATKRRISEGSAARLVRRRKWQRRADPDNVMRILVPDMATNTPNRGRGPQPAIEVLRMAVESLTERLRRADEDIRREREPADRAEGVRDAALEAANRADAEAAAARGRLADMETGQRCAAGEGALGAAPGCVAREGMTHVVGHNCVGRAMEPEGRRSRHTSLTT